MNFDPVARSYRLLETLAFGNALQHARTAFIPEARGSKHALVVGEGNGRFLADLVVNSSVQIHCIDASRKMLALAQKHMANNSRVHFHHADILESTLPDAFYDLIVTHFFLDCFDAEQLPHVIAKLARAASPKTQWLIADFAIPCDRLARLHAKIWLSAMYSFFALTTGLEVCELVDPTPLLKSAGFRLHNETLGRSGLIKSQIWERAL